MYKANKVSNWDNKIYKTIKFSCLAVPKILISKEKHKALPGK